MKRGQFWYADFMIAVVIIMIIGLLFAVSIADITSRNEIIKELILDASDISTTLISEGYGDFDYWESGRGTIGIVTNYKLDTDKFNNFLNLNYDKQKSMLGTLNNIWIYLADKGGDIKISNANRIGLPINSINDISQYADNLVHIKRFVFYDDNQDGKGDIFILGVVVWQ